MSAVSISSRPTLLQRILPKRLVARGARQMWGPMLPVVSHLSPRVLSSFSSMMDTEDFAKVVSETPDDQLAAGMNTKLRGVILGEIVRRMKDEFVASRAGDLDAVIEFEITGRPDGGVDVYQIQITNSTCTVGEGRVFSDAPASTIEVGSVDFLKMATGCVSGIDLYLGGKLKWDGGLMMLTRLTRMFNIPETAGPSKQTAAA